MNKYILVLGGTGATGSLVIHNLIQKGEKVCAIVRSKEKLISALPGRDDTPPEDVLRIIESTILDMKKEEVEICILSSKAVICCLGHNISIKGIFGSPRKLVKDSIQRLCETYKELRPSAPKKFILMGTVGAANPDGSDDIRSIGDRIAQSLLRILIPPAADNEAAAAYLSKDIGHDSLIPWVTVRPDALIDADASAYNVTHKPSGSLFGSAETSRSNVALFMCKLIIDDSLWKTWEYKMPVIHNTND
jgi:nucleoside-diphosphate-sugar epimerase